MKNTLPAWDKYWHNFFDLALLKNKLNNLDDTLKCVEQEFDCKLLSGDQMDLVDELENRIDELTNMEKQRTGVVQGDLFEIE